MIAKLQAILRFAKRARNEPVLLLGLLAVALQVTFDQLTKGVDVSTLAMAVAEACLTWIARSNVVPVAKVSKAVAPDGTTLVVSAEDVLYPPLPGDEVR